MATASKTFLLATCGLPQACEFPPKIPFIPKILRRFEPFTANTLAAILSTRIREMDGSKASASQRNVLYLNNHDGTFSDVSAIAGLDFPDDSRSFALADLDHDGRLEVILKNRNAPQLRILHNAMKDLGNSIAFRLRGTKSNRDAIGAAVTVEAAEHRQTKYLQAGSGFLSQHTKELFFGVGTFEGTVRATIHWPSGRTQSFEQLPINHR